MQDDGILGCGNWFAFPYFISFFILNAIIILDLSIGVFINALSDAKKFQKAQLNGEKMDLFLELWSEYDPEATGWITADQLLFLFYELPSPLGHGMDTNKNYEEYSNFDKIYEKLTRENSFIAKCQADNKVEDELELNQITKLKFDNEYYLVNKTKGIIIKEAKAARIVSLYNIRLYEERKVHFKEVILQLIKNVFDSTKEDYMPNAIVQGKFDKKWKNKYKKQLKKKKVTFQQIDLYMAGRMIMDKYRRIKTTRNDRFNDNLEVNEANYYLDNRDRTKDLDFKNLRSKNPFSFKIYFPPSSKVIPEANFYESKNNSEDESDEEISKFI
jgi:hypothetical protein